MWRSLEHWMKASGLGDCPRKLLEELREVHSMAVVLPTRDRRELRLRVVSRPEGRLSQLLDLLRLPLPNAPKLISNVVPKKGRVPLLPSGLKEGRHSIAQDTDLADTACKIRAFAQSRRRIRTPPPLRSGMALAKSSKAPAFAPPSMAPGPAVHGGALTAPPRPRRQPIALRWKTQHRLIDSPSQGVADLDRSGHAPC